uniref:Uncharacterized protein n=1 Tax=Arundo donax TaxID=35708 RepID=A0A0A9BVW0_ARUDO
MRVSPRHVDHQGRTHHRSRVPSWCHGPLEPHSCSGARAVTQLAAGRGDMRIPTGRMQGMRRRSGGGAAVVGLYHRPGEKGGLNRASCIGLCYAGKRRIPGRGGSAEWPRDRRQRRLGEERRAELQR